MTDFPRTLRVAAAVVFHGSCSLVAFADDAPVSGAVTASPTVETRPPAPAVVRPARKLDLLEIVVDGNTVLDSSDILEAMQPFLGPDKTPEDVDRARAALEKLYADRGYKTVSVTIPRQKVNDGTVMLTVTEGRIRRMTVVGSKYHSLEHIRREAASLAEGKVPDFNAVQQDLVALNSTADLSVTPSLKNGPAPGLMDVDLVTTDKLPLHGMLELNNRFSQNTTHRRISASVSYDNLWQRGDSAALFMQTAPDRPADGKVFLFNYVHRYGREPFSLQFNALHTSSDVAALGGVGVVGRGRSMGLRGNWQLPSQGDVTQSLSLGVDAKHFRNRVLVGGASNDSPLDYYPVSLTYSRGMRHDNSTLQVDTTLNFAFASLGSDSEELNLTRYHTTGQMLYLRSVLNYTRFLPKGFELGARSTVQMTAQPLISNEQLTAGGMDSVRGYLESEAQGDYGLTGGLELRAPSLPDVLPEGRFTHAVQELKPFVFVDGASLHLRQALPDNDANIDLLGAGAGVTMNLWSRVNGVLDWSRPMTSGPSTHAGQSRVLFRLWTTF